MNLRRGYRPLIVAIVTAAASLTAVATASASSANSMAHIPGSYLPTSATKTGQLSASRMSVEVVLQPANKAGLSSLLGSLYTPGSADYGHWLAAGQFDSQFAPSRATVQAMTAYLRGKGLSVQRTETPFLLRAVGSSAQIDTAFATTINNYRSAKGVKF
jgi:subtilase family serine protease